MVEVFLLNLTSRLEKPVEKFLHFFTPRRREKILRHKFLADRNRTLWTELLIRSVIAKKNSCPIEEILIEREKSGKPYVVDSNLKISLSHSANWAACTVGEVQSGVDVEENFSDALDIAKNFFSAREYRELCELDGRARAEKFLCLWTLKESFAKFSGRNLDDVLRLEKIVGKNFFVAGAVVGVCTVPDALPENFTVVPKIFFNPDCMQDNSLGGEKNR